jgi:hypothetical protein
VNRNGVIYSTGAVFSGRGWKVRTRPRLDPRVAGRELQIIRDDLHCNFGIADSTSVALHQLPLIGRLIRPG